MWCALPDLYDLKELVEESLMGIPGLGGGHFEEVSKCLHNLGRKGPHTHPMELVHMLQVTLKFGIKHVEIWKQIGLLGPMVPKIGC